MGDLFFEMYAERECVVLKITVDGGIYLFRHDNPAPVGCCAYLKDKVLPLLCPPTIPASTSSMCANCHTSHRLDEKCNTTTDPTLAQRIDGVEQIARMNAAEEGKLWDAVRAVELRAKMAGDAAHANALTLATILKRVETGANNTAGLVNDFDRMTRRVEAIEKRVDELGAHVEECHRAVQGRCNDHARQLLGMETIVKSAMGDAAAIRESLRKQRKVANEELTKRVAELEASVRKLEAVADAAINLRATENGVEVVQALVRESVDAAQVLRNYQKEQRNIWEAAERGCAHAAQGSCPQCTPPKSSAEIAMEPMDHEEGVRDMQQFVTTPEHVMRRKELFAEYRAAKSREKAGG